MIVLDTSVAVPAALPEHVAHRSVLAALPREKTRVIAHVAMETYSVLTRLPPSQRVSGEVALSYLGVIFDFPPLVLAAGKYFDVLEVAAAQGIPGGAVYDAIVGATATQAGATLLTRDHRAIATYKVIGVPYRLIG